MSARRLVKRAVFGAALAAASPLIALAWLEKRLGGGEGVFAGLAQLVALAPGSIGCYLRAAYYYGTLDACSWETRLGFGTVINHRGAHVAATVSSGLYCVIGHAHVGPGVRMASHVSIPSGKRQHLAEDGSLSDETHFDDVSIGAGCWVGEGAIILADVGAETIVSAGSVVIKPMPDRAIVGGNPAKVLKSLDAPAIERAS